MTKNLSILWLVALVFLICYGCSEDRDPMVTNAKVEFTFSILTDSDNGGRMQSAEFPDGASLKISISDANMATIISNRIIPIVKLGQEYVTEPLELPGGKYYITDFMILKDSEIIYATPKHNSPLANLVSHPLPYSFNISKDKISNVRVQVVEAKNQSPAGFGYVSFNPEIVTPILISVFVPEENRFSLTDARAYVVDGADTISSHQLSAKVNVVNFKGDPDKEYTLIVTKEDYDDFERSFIYKDLKAEVAGLPLKLILEPLLKMTIAVTGEEEESQDISLNLKGTGTITVQQPGGETENYSLPADFSVLFPEKGNYTIKVKGSLKGITGFRAFAYANGVSHISGLRHLTNLEEFSLPGDPYFVGKLDFTHNKKLFALDLFALGMPEMFILPEEHYIKYLTFSFVRRKITTREIDQLINNIHANAVRRNLHDGHIHLSVTEFPSAEAEQKADELIHQYGWDVRFDY